MKKRKLKGKFREFLKFVFEKNKDRIVFLRDLIFFSICYGFPINFTLWSLLGFNLTFYTVLGYGVAWYLISTELVKTLVKLFGGIFRRR